MTQPARRRNRLTMNDVVEHARVSVTCMNDVMAIGAMEHCRGVGLRVPEEVSVVGFDDLPVSALLTPRLTTVRRPAHDMGFRAASALFDLLKNDGSGAIGELPATVQVRDSVRPPSVVA